MSSKKDIYAYIMLAEGCNLKCSYCYEHLKKPKMISTQVFDDSIKYLKERYNLKNLILFGGEPTLNKEVLEHALRTVDQEIPLILITNGVNAEDSTLELIKTREKMIIQVSLDGTFHTMQQRIGKNKELFDKIIDNSRRYRSALKETEKLYFHSTVVKENIAGLYENILFLESLGITKYVNTTTDFLGDWNKQDLLLYESQMMMLSDHIKSGANLEINTLEASEFENKIKNSCGAGVSSIIINSDGYIYPCSRLYTNFGDKYKIGSVYDKKELDNLLFKNLSYEWTKCSKCEINNCIRCFSANLESSGDMLNVLESHCEMSKLRIRLGKYHKKK